MTVEAYLRSLVFGIEIPTEVLERCARSPKGVSWNNTPLKALSLGDDIDAHDDDDTYEVRLDYASASLYYSVLGKFSGGGYSERVDDIQISRSGQTITQADRDRMKMLADRLLAKWGFEALEDVSEGFGMFDATYLTL